jgi:hypothetical protein
MRWCLQVIGHHRWLVFVHLRLLDPLGSSALGEAGSREVVVEATLERLVMHPASLASDSTIHAWIHLAGGMSKRSTHMTPSSTPKCCHRHRSSAPNRLGSRPTSGCARPTCVQIARKRVVNIRSSLCFTALRLFEFVLESDGSRPGCAKESTDVQTCRVLVH